MEKIVNSVSAYLASPSSRRGFVGTLGKLALGTGVMLAGGAAALGSEGGPHLALASSGCCGGTPCSNGCPSGTTAVGYTCCAAYDCSSHIYQCYDCDNTSTHQIVCTYGYPTPQICPCTPQSGG